jgi:UDP-hydrolysing UDP-N-acetyl-D-glucosamine 2-epimerase
LVAGDRYEALGFAIACYYMNIPIAHMFGGDRSIGGNLDDSVRHAITKLSHIHFATNNESFDRLLALGEEEHRVHNVGSPVVDAIHAGDFASPKEVKTFLGLDINKVDIVFTQHPVTTEVDLIDLQLLPSLEALKELTEYNIIITYPNMDAGSNEIVSFIERYEHLPHFHVHHNLGRRMYLGLLNVAKLVVGNSSSGLMETPAFRLATIDVGPRQEGRTKGNNVISVPYNKVEIQRAINIALYDSDFRRQLSLGYNPYGYGGTCDEILSVLRTVKLDRKLLQKRITY